MQTIFCGELVDAGGILYFSVGQEEQHTAVKW